MWSNKLTNLWFIVIYCNYFIVIFHLFLFYFISFVFIFTDWLFYCNCSLIYFLFLVSFLLVITFDLKVQPASISFAICGLRRIIIVFSLFQTNKMEMENGMENGKLRSQALKMLYKPLQAVYIASYKEPLDQSDCWKVFVQLWNYTKNIYCNDWIVKSEDKRSWAEWFRARLS